MKPSRKILGIRLRNFDSSISKEMNWVGAILDYLDEQAESQETKASEESTYGLRWKCPCDDCKEFRKQHEAYEGKSYCMKVDCKWCPAKLQDEPKECPECHAFSCHVFLPCSKMLKEKS